MLEPRSASGSPRAAAPPRPRRRRARGRRAAPPVSPCPRMSKRTAASPRRAAAAAMSAWFSLRDPAPWRITSPPHGSPSGMSSRCARATAGMRHACAPIMAAATFSVYPEAVVRRSDGRLAIGGCDAVELAREFGTPAYVMAEDDLRARARAFRTALETHHDGPGEVVFASKACPVDRGAAAVRRGGPRRATSPRAASCTWRSRPASSPSASTCTATRSPRRSCALAVEAGVGWVVVDNAEDVAKLARVLPAGRAPARAAADPPGRRRRHARGDPDRPRRVEVRPRPARGARARAATRPTHLDVQGFHFHLGSQLVDPTPYRAAIGVLAGLGDQPVYSLGGGYAVAYTSDDRPPGIDVVGRRRRRGGARPARPGQAARDRARPRARRERRRDALHRRVGQAAARRRRGSSPSTAACPTTRGRCSTTPPTRPASPTASARRASPRRSSASTASPATCSSAARGCPTRSRATCS